MRFSCCRNLVAPSCPTCAGGSFNLLPDGLVLLYLIQLKGILVPALATMKKLTLMPLRKEAHQPPLSLPLDLFQTGPPKKRFAFESVRPLKGIYRILCDHRASSEGTRTINGPLQHPALPTCRLRRLIFRTCEGTQPRGYPCGSRFVAEAQLSRSYKDIIGSDTTPEVAAGQLTIAQKGFALDHK